MAGDWIKLHRGLLESQQFSDPDMLRVWIWLLLRANYKPSWFAGERIEIGQVALSELNSAEALKLSRSKFHRVLVGLETARAIERKVNRRFTVVTICNWSTYQNSDDVVWTTDEQLVNNGWTAGEPLVNTSKEGKKGRREEGKKNTYVCAAPPSVAEVAAYCTAEGYHTVDASTFVAHYESNGWKVGGKAPMKSWKSACVTWHQRNLKSNNSRGSPTYDREAENAKALAALNALDNDQPNPHSDDLPLLRDLRA